jgi:hypothetical protein
MITDRKTKGLGKICLTATPATKTHTWTALEVNPGLCHEKVATNNLSHGMALPIPVGIAVHWLFPGNYKNL